MERIAGFIIRRRRAVTVLFIIAALLGALFQRGVPVKYGLAEYLPPSSNSTVAVNLLKEEFTSPVPNARVMLREVTLTEALAYKDALREINGVSNVMWLDDVIDLMEPIELADQKVVAQYYADNCAAISLTISDNELVSAVNGIYELIGEENAISGEAVYRYSGQAIAGKETANSMMVAIPLVLLVLLLSTSSWLEPLLFFCAIGAAVAINNGINFFFGDISFITKSVSPILQLAVSMDYAIFLLHAFADYRNETDDVQRAMILAVKRASTSIAASALTTLFGFSALCFMNFRVGADLGLNLAKGVVLSYLSVMFFLPALTICCYKLLDKTRHRRILPMFRSVGTLLSKLRIPVLIIALVIAVPCFLAQNRGVFTYGTGGYDPASRQYADDIAIEEVFGIETPIVLLVPRGEPAKELSLSRELEKLPHVTSVVSYTLLAGIEIPPEIAGEAVAEMFYSANYARIVAYTDTDSEGETAFAVVENVRETADSFYDTVYSCGESVNLYDVKNVVQSDHSFINLLAIGLCALVITLAFKSLTLPVILLLTIELAIWINMSFSYFTDTPLSYVGYLVISTVQLGATVDYAILFSDHYMALRKNNRPARAVYLAHGETFQSIIVSASTLALAGLALYLTSSNPVVQALGMLLSRGTVLSFLLVNCFLPAALIVLDRIIPFTTVKAGFQKGKKEV